ncbi:hypothetical protein KIS4809_0285 [Bacillus sp. ZZV12-4809]|nr:hypothetical protein KIS4809_0285 [Bacillus sp. ZZV12-4809]
MLTLFRYNWQVRDEWFEWCRQRTAERAECQPDWRSWRHSGFHIADVEYSWICVIQGKEVKIPCFPTMDKVMALSEEYRREVETFFQEE